MKRRRGGDGCGAVQDIFATEEKNWEYAMSVPQNKYEHIFDKFSVRYAPIIKRATSNLTLRAPNLSSAEANSCSR